MVPTPDELAGAVDRFGGLTRAELTAVMADLAARAGTGLDPAALDRAIDEAIEEYYLLELEHGSESDPQSAPTDPLVIAGPAALPRLPEGGEDLPHLLDVEPRPIDRRAAARQVEDRLREDAAATIAAGDIEAAERLLDACYEVEAWGPVDLADAKAGLGDLLE